MATLQVIETTAIALLVLTIAGAIRRLYFHPLSHIPGPKLAALTWWYEFYFDGIQPGRYVFQIQELHKQYGVSRLLLFSSSCGLLHTTPQRGLTRRDRRPDCSRHSRRNSYQ